MTNTSYAFGERTKINLRRSTGQLRVGKYLLKKVYTGISK